MQRGTTCSIEEPSQGGWSWAAASATHSTTVVELDGDVTPILGAVRTNSRDGHHRLT